MCFLKASIIHLFDISASHPPYQFLIKLNAAGHRHSSGMGTSHAVFLTKFLPCVYFLLPWLVIGGTCYPDFHSLTGCKVYRFQSWPQMELPSLSHGLSVTSTPTPPSGPVFLSCYTKTGHNIFLGGVGTEITNDWSWNRRISSTLKVRPVSQEWNRRGKKTQ